MAIRAIADEVKRRRSLMNATPVVSMRGVTKVFQTGNMPVVALKDITLEIKAGEFVAITGPSGSGKTSLLNLVGCLDQPTSGSIEIDSVPIANLSSNALSQLRAEKMGLIFQSFNLIPVLTVEENVEYPLYFSDTPPDKRRRQQMVADTLINLGIEELKHRRPNELSGGQCQRVAIARALIAGPTIVLADEPTSNLDSHTGASILELMKRLNLQHGVTFIFSTHDFKLVDMAKRVIELRDGEILGDYFS